MKKLKVTLSLLLILILSFASPVLAATRQGVTYTRLGDSIAYGTGAADRYGYTDMFNDHLTRIYGEGVYNSAFAEDGQTGSELLDSLSAFDVKAAVASSDFITISIGGNDLLEPFMTAFASLISTCYLTPEYTIDSEQLMMDLAGWQADPTDPDYSHFNGLLADLQSIFTAAVYAFGEQTWPAIIREVRTVNYAGGKYGDIYVNTVYNPFVNIPILHAAIDPFVRGLNTAIKGYATVYDYKVVDVYSRFEAYSNPKKLAVGDLSNLAEFLMDPTTVPVPLHPTDRGYKFIFNMHKNLMD